MIAQFINKRLLASVAAVVFAAALFGLNAGFTIYWVHNYGQHACQALDIILKSPGPKHPTATQQNFRHAIVLWHDADGC